MIPHPHSPVQDESAVSVMAYNLPSDYGLMYPYQQAQAAQAVLNPLSCEVCRRRKTKCDRKLCVVLLCKALDYQADCLLQVQHVPTAAMHKFHATTRRHGNGETSGYHRESGVVADRACKRGPQVGYLSVLESRLIATEVALYEVLSKLHSLHDAGPTTSTDDLISRLQKKYTDMPYSAKTAEWNQQPLNGEHNQRRWWHERQQTFAAAEPPPDRPRQPTNSQMEPPAWLPTVSNEDINNRKRRAQSQSSIQEVDTEDGMMPKPNMMRQTSFSPSSTNSASAFSPDQGTPWRSMARQDVPIALDPGLAALGDQELRKYF